MRTLSIIGYAPPDTNIGWGGELGPLDAKHGVFPNHVMTPLLATALHLAIEERNEFLEHIKCKILEEGNSKSQYRLNALTKSLTPKKGVPWGDLRTALDEQAKLLLTEDARNRLWIVVGYWPTCALVSHIVTGNTDWTSISLRDFADEFLELALKEILERVDKDYPSSVPNDGIARTGLLFRFFTHSSEDLHHAALRACIQKLWDTRKFPVRDNLDSIVLKLRALVPIPHNEIYQTYSEDNPIGKFQSVFIHCKDSKVLRREECGGDVFWKYIGERIASRLVCPLR